jgi:hypothetical protein
LLSLGFWLIWDLVIYQRQLIEDTDFIDPGSGFIPDKTLHQQKVRLRERQKGKASPSPNSSFRSKAISSIEAPEVLNDIQVAELKDLLVSWRKSVGAQIRTNFVAIVSWQGGDSWRLESIDF